MTRHLRYWLAATAIMLILGGGVAALVGLGSGNAAGAGRHEEVSSAPGPAVTDHCVAPFDRGRLTMAGGIIQGTVYNTGINNGTQAGAVYDIGADEHPSDEVRSRVHGRVYNTGVNNGTQVASRGGADDPPPAGSDDPC
jgi:hypothetical protein